MDNNNVVVLYPSAGIGHLISMVELGKLVLSHSSSISSIIILTPSFPSITGSYSCYISSVSSSFPSITFLSLPCSVPLPLGDPCNYEDFEHLAFEILRENNPNVLHCLKSIISPISAFIIDLFCFPALEISQTLNIPTYFFFTSNASALACYLNFPSFDKKVSYDNNFVANNNNPTTTYCGSYDIPGLFSVPASHMIDHFHKRGASYYKFIEMARAFPKSNGIIINTFESLEVAAVDGLIKGTCLPCTKIPPIYCVGPLIANRGETGKNKRHECLTWLDSQPKTSVVYLGFGSRGMFSKEQLCEIAFGLERSGVRFLWAVRAPPSGEKGGAFTQTLEPNFDQLLPFGFLDRVQDRGYVVKSWVPQIEVLGHPSVGGFVSHCGWNSTLEALILGVPMVAWPLYAEQRFNKFLLVNKIGIALPMDESSENRFVTSCEIENRLKQILNSKEGDLVRKRMMEFKDKAANTQIEGGSTSLALNVLINSWKKHI